MSREGSKSGFWWSSSSACGVCALIVENKVIVELKTVDDLSNAHYAQVRSYLTATGLPIAQLVNFAKEKADFRRVEKP